MAFPDDRGRVVRITFDIVYATGQMKTVAMNMSDSDWGNTAVIALSETGVRSIVGPGVEASGGASAQSLDSMFDTVEDGGKYKPALLIVRDDLEATVTCGAHRSLSHRQADDSVEKYI